MSPPHPGLEPHIHEVGTRLVNAYRAPLIPLRATGVIAALIACIATAGCGGAASTTVPTTRTPSATATSPATTKAEFIAAGDAICRSSDAAIKQFKQRIKELEGESNASVVRSLPPILRQTVASERASITKLRSLPEPAAGASTITKWLTAESESVTDQSNFADALANEEGAAREAAQQDAKNARALAHGLAQGYGFKVCGAEEE
jgi:hypothetical protein